MQESSINWQVKKRKFIESCNTVLTFLASFIVIMAALETASPAFIFKEIGFEFYDVRYFWFHVCIVFLLTYLISLIRYYLKRHPDAQGAFIMMDIDYFKGINDRHGGDEFCLKTT